MSTSLIFVLSFLLSLIHLIAGFLFPTAAPAPAPSSCCPSPPPPPPPMCCQPAPPPPPPTCCSSPAPPAPTCGGGCGGRRRYRSKREADLMPPGIRDEEKEECHNPMLREAIEESITFQLASSIRKLNFRLQKSDFASNRYIAICMLTEEPYKFFCPTQKFCTHGNEQITCHVFEG